MKKLILPIFLFCLVTLTLGSYLFVDQNLSYLNFLYTGFWFSNRVLVSIIYATIVGILFVSYFLILKHAKYFENNIWKIIGIVVAILILSYPAALSYDIFNYVTTAKVAFHYHENPYVIYPIEFLGDPYLVFTRATNKTALYGPLWIGITALPFILGFGNFIFTLFLFKLVPLIFYLGICWSIYKLSNKLNVLYFALNPLVLIETFVSGHNDVVMMFFALLSFYFIFQKKFGFSIISLLCSILIKFSTMFLIPVYLFAIFKKNTDQEKIFKYAAFSMFIIFLLSPFREELYPWYAIWFITFVSLISSKLIRSFVIVLSFALLMRYIPYMWTGYYFGITPVLREILTVIPIILFLLIVCLKKFYRS